MLLAGYGSLDYRICLIVVAVGMYCCKIPLEIEDRVSKATTNQLSVGDMLGVWITVVRSLWHCCRGYFYE